MALPTFTLSFVNTPPYFSGTGSSTLVPSVFPVAINGRPYMLDQRSAKFIRGYEQRVRDSQDISTAPGESAINPGGLWRRGQDSWHLGAGQQYADVAEAQNYRFYKSKGIDPWVKGQISLLNSTRLASSSAFSSTNLPMIEVNGYVYIGDNKTLKYTQDPFATTPTWTSVTTGAPDAVINDITTDGKQIYVSYLDEGIMMTTIGGASLTDHYSTTGGTYNYPKLGFAKGFVIGFHNNTDNSQIHIVPYTASTSHGTEVATIREPGFVCTGIAGGQTHIYVAGHNNDTGLIYRLGIKTDGTVDVAVVALELPIGEYPTALDSYLGSIIIGTNKGVRFATADNGGNLIAGSLIPTTSSVRCFTAEDRFVWFGWSNYDGTDGGLGRLDLSTFTAANTPAFASDLMYGSTANILSCVSLSGKRIFAISGIGIVTEDSTSLVTSGNIEGGTWRWGIPDRKFVAKIDARAEPLSGSITAALSTDAGSYENLDTWSTTGEVEYTYEGSDYKTIEAAVKFILTRASATSGPVLTRWMARAYAAPFRSQVFSVPLLLHRKIRVRDKDYYFDVDQELETLDALISDPRIVVLQIGNQKHTAIMEDIEWVPIDSTGNQWEWEGTATVTLRSVEN